MPLLALTTLAACGNSTSASSVTVVGDSATAAQQAELQSVLHPLYDPTFIVRANAGIAEMSGLLSSSINSNGTPKVVVVNLGTADALRADGTAGTAGAAGTAGTAGQPLTAVVSTTGGVSCVVLTTINVRTDRRNSDGIVSDLATRINHQIKALADSDPTKYKVVDWNEFLSTLPAPSVPTYLEGNGIVEAPAGASWLARSDLAAIRACGSTHQPTVIGPNTA